MAHMISSQSVEDVLVPVRAISFGKLVNPTGDNVWVAFLPQGEVPNATPGPTWVSSTWESDTTGHDPVYYAVCSVGPGTGAQLEPGTYSVFVKIAEPAGGSSNPETPIIQAPNLLRVY